MWPPITRFQNDYMQTIRHLVQTIAVHIANPHQIMRLNVPVATTAACRRVWAIRVTIFSLFITWEALTHKWAVSSIFYRLKKLNFLYTLEKFNNIFRS